MALPYRKVDRYQVLKEITRLITQNPENEVEVSSSELADRFNVQAPTMDYHLAKLVDDGLLILSPKRGKYKRKIYRLPSENKEKNSEKVEIHNTLTPQSAEKFKQFLEQHKQNHNKNVIQETETKKEPIIEQEPEPTPEPVVLAPEPTHIVEEEPAREVKVVAAPIETAELTLDDRISKFLNEANMVHDANELLQHEDKEILSVMNETLQQTSVYLKDLSEQLSTIQNKQLIQQLIDDRNRMLAQMERLEREADEARAQANRTIEKYEVDPNRVRFMHQMVVSTVDDFVNRPNHAMALGRTDFRNKVSKEVSDLVKYVLHLEK